MYHMRTITATAARKEFFSLLNKRQRVRVIGRRGVMELVPVKPTQDDIDQADIKEHRRVMKRIRAGKDKVMTSDQLLDYLGIR